MDVIVSKINGNSCLDAPRELVGKVVDLTVVDLSEKRARVRVRDERELKLISTGGGLRLIRGDGNVFDVEELDGLPF